MLVVVVVVVALAGCGMPGELVVQPGQDVAVAAVWNDAYGRSDPPPEIWWVSGDELNCAGGRGFVNPESGECRGGLTVSPWKVVVEWPGDDSAWGALAHELWHVALQRQPRWSGGFSDGDPTHQGPWWKPGGLEMETEAMVTDLMCDLSQGCIVR